MFTRKKMLAIVFLLIIEQFLTILGGMQTPWWYPAQVLHSIWVWLVCTMQWYLTGLCEPSFAEYAFYE